MLVTSDESDLRRASAARENDVLDHLMVQHEAMLSCAGVVDEILQRKKIAAAGHNLADDLLDELLDAPDDFHHFTERRLFRRLWFRLGRFLPRYFDLDEMHRERRAARDAAAVLRVSRAARYWRDRESCSALSNLCRLVRAQIEAEETQFYPLLRAKLLRSDWLDIEEEIRAFEACSRSLRDRRLHS